MHVQQTIYITFLLLHQRARPSGANDTETLDETVINDIKSSAAKHKENGAGARQRRGALSQVPVPVPAPPPSYNAPRSTAAQTQIGNKQSSAETQLQKEQPSDAATGAAATGSKGTLPRSTTVTVKVSRKNKSLPAHSKSAIPETSTSDPIVPALGEAPPPPELSVLRVAAPLGSRSTKPAAAAAAPKKRGRPRKNPPRASDPGDGLYRIVYEEEEEKKPSRPLRKRRKASVPATASAVPPVVHALRPTRQRKVLSESKAEDEFDDQMTEDIESDSSETESASEGGNGSFRVGRSSGEEDEEEEDEGGGGSMQHRKQRKTSKRAQRKRKRSNAVAKQAKEKKIRLVDQELDPENWSLKDIVRWGNARDRRLAVIEKESEDKEAVDAAATTAVGDGDGAGPSSLPTSNALDRREHQQQEQEPNRAKAASLPPPPPHHPVISATGTTGGVPTGSSLAPQVTIATDGRIVVNRQSLTVQAQEKQTFTRFVTEDNPRLNSMTYMNRITNERWSAEDTELFYRALSQFGTDFTLIAHLFPGRQRRHLKNKYSRENKLNPIRVDEALRASANATINSYKEMIVMLKESGMNVGGRSMPLDQLEGPQVPEIEGEKEEEEHSGAPLDLLAATARGGDGGAGPSDIDDEQMRRAQERAPPVNRKKEWKRRPGKEPAREPML